MGKSLVSTEVGHGEPKVTAMPPPSRPGIAARLSDFSDRRRHTVAAIWIALILIAAPFAATIMSVLSGGGWFVPGSQSQEAAQVLSDADLLGRGELNAALLVRDNDHTVADAAFAERVRQAVDTATKQQDLPITSVFGWSTLGPGTRDQFLGADRRTVINSIAIGLNEGDARRELPEVQDRLTEMFADQRLDVTIVSQDALFGALNAVSQEDLVIAEIITMPLIALILLLLYRSVAAVAASMAVGVSTIVLTLGILSPIAHHVQLSLFMGNAATMLGLGVGIDYSLFVISRFQEELTRGSTVSESVAIALRRSGHTVVYSGLTVLATTATLFLIPMNIIWSLAIGAITAVAVAMLVCTLLLPALLHLLGNRINWGRPPLLKPRRAVGDPAESGRWRSFALGVMRRPVIYGLAGVAFMCLLAYPAMDAKTFTPDVSVLPAEEPTRQGFETIASQFGPGVPSPVRVVVTSPVSLVQDPAANAAYLQLVERLSELPHVEQTLSFANVLGQVSPDITAASRTYAVGGYASDVRQSVQYFLSHDARTTVIELRPDTLAAGEGAYEVLDGARQVVAQLSDTQLHAVVGGETAEGHDNNQLIEQRLPWVIVAMLAVVFAVLLVTFRSLVLPVKAIVLNLLSIGATFGIMVVVFQYGFGTDVLPLDHTGYLQNFVPVLMLAILFGLSTDYEVFLLNRVREAYLRTGDNTAAVAEGVEATGPLISGAAVLMVTVFGAFAFTGIVPIAQLGFGMAVGVLIDATVVRLILVPTSMRLLGDWNWWLPGQPRPNSKTHHSVETIQQADERRDPSPVAAGAEQ
jgi:RND superfamily putative drug exporter